MIFNKNKNIKFLILTILIISITIFLLAKVTMPSNIYSDISYNNNQKNFYEQSLINQDRKIKLSFIFNFDEYQHHDNLFEITPLPGKENCCTVRMEFGERYIKENNTFTNDLALVIGRENLVGSTIKFNVELKKNNSIHLEILNGNVRVKYNNKDVWVNQHEDLGNKFNKITIGYGYDKKRYFNGVINNVKISTFERYSIRDYTVLLLIFFLSSISLIYTLKNINIFNLIDPKYLKTENQIEMKLNIISKIIFFGFLISIFYKIILFNNFGIDYPQNIPYMFKPNTTFGDFFTTYNQSIRLETYWNKEGAVPANYFPFAYILTYPLTLIHSNTSLVIFLLITYSLGFFIVYYYLNKLDYLDNLSKKILFLLVLTMTNYGFLFSFDRGNYEIFIYIFISLSLIFLINNKIFSFMFMVILGSMIKPYAAIYSLLIVDIYQLRKTFFYYSIFTILFIFIFIFFLSLFNGGFIYNFNNLLRNLTLVNNIYANNFLHYFSLSIVEPIKFLKYYYESINPQLIANIITGISLLSSIIIFFERTFLWKKVAFLTCLITCLTPITHLEMMYSIPLR